MIRILKEAETNRGEIFAREDPVDSVEEPVRAILAQVKARGDEALKEYTKAFDGVELTSLEVGPGRWTRASAARTPFWWRFSIGPPSESPPSTSTRSATAFWSMRRTASSWGEGPPPGAGGALRPRRHRRLSLQRADELHPRQAGRGEGDLHGDPAGEKWEDSPQHPGGGPDLRGGPGVSGGGRPSGGRPGLRHGRASPRWIKLVVPATSLWRRQRSRCLARWALTWWRSQ